jgi:hypothetical protein
MIDMLPDLIVVVKMRVTHAELVRRGGIDTKAVKAVVCVCFPSIVNDATGGNSSIEQVIVAFASDEDDDVPG